jgi:hypothetical protein
MERIMTNHKLAFMFLALVLCATVASAQPAGAKKLDPCALVGRADVQLAVGQSVTGPTPNKLNAAVCDYKVGDSGAVGFTAQLQKPGETPDRIMAELKKMNIPATEAKGIGDRAFFASPGYGMTQLNAFKGPNYIIVTLLIPGAPEAKQKTIAEALMQKALSKL